MCGIISLFQYNNQDYKSRFVTALNSLKHRGPDNLSYSSFSNIVIGHTRLSIIDTSADSNQPLTIEDGSSIVFNGEIYNYQDLKRKYLNDLKFKSKGDAEVVLRGFNKYGTDFFKLLDGIYAIAIVTAEKELILARDPIGIKPLYIYENKDFFIAASEIKAILKFLDKNPTPNYPVLYNYISLGFCPEPETAFMGISALSPGALKCVSQNGITEGKFSELNQSSAHALILNNIFEYLAFFFQCFCMFIFLSKSIHGCL